MRLLANWIEEKKATGVWYSMLFSWFISIENCCLPSTKQHREIDHLDSQEISLSSIFSSAGKNNDTFSCFCNYCKRDGRLANSRNAKAHNLATSLIVYSLLVNTISLLNDWGHAVISMANIWMFPLLPSLCFLRPTFSSQLSFGYHPTLVDESSLTSQIIGNVQSIR